ncbi:MAG: fasciclin domain-containing protein [Chloroflexi bacterium]|nr:fasciclin domain-containing protein [Chloroflexota bacterium]
MKKFGALLLIGAITMVLVACSSDEETTPDVVATTSPMPTQQPMGVTKTIVDIAVEDGRFETLVAALQAADLVSTLSGEGPFTVFAPTDDAFAALPDGVVAGLLEDIPSLTEVLTYHVVSGTVLAETVVGLTSAATLQGEEVTIEVIDGSVKIDGATVVITDIIGSNGVIHVIDSVILPTEIAASLSSPEATKTIVDIAVEDGRFETLVAALQAADLVSTLSGEGPFTVFAPTDDAFAALPDGVVAGLLEDIPSLTEVLTYHVVSGTVLAETLVGLTSAATLQGEEVTIEVIDPNRPPLTIGNVMIDGATVLITDIIGSNGVIHVIDAVILPSAIAASLATPEDAMDSMVVSKTIVDIAVEDGRFGTLVTALQAAGLVETLSGDGPFTVFAPTDDAFAALPDGVVAGLLEDIPALTDVLTYHVISGSVLAEQVVGLTSATTLQGEDVTIAVNDGSVMIDGAKVIITDIIGSNGVIHVIDAVILP